MAEGKQANIQIEAGPAGILVRVEYTGPIDSVPSAIERLKAAGILDLVQASRTLAPTNGTKPRAPKVEPIYNGDGAPCCPLHNRRLTEGTYGLFCSAKAAGSDVADKRGYCGLRFG